MTSKQQRTGQLQNMPPTPKKVIPYSMVFMNLNFGDSKNSVLTGLQHNHRGVYNVDQYYLQENGQTFISAVRIDMKSEDFAKELIANNKITIGEQNYSIETSGRSLIVMKVSANVSIENLSRDLSHNYTTIENVSRFYDTDNNPVDCVRVNFKSDSGLTQFLKDKYLFIDGKKCPVQSYWSLVSVKSTDAQPKNQIENAHEQTKPVAYRPRSTVLTEKRVRQLFAEQQQQLEAMVEQFENKWNARLSALTNSSNNIVANQLTPIIHDLSNVCQQVTQQNTQIQRQLNIVSQRMKNVQTTSNYSHEFPSLPIQNGH